VGYDTLTSIGERSWLSTVEALLAEVVYAQGRHDEAEQLTRASEESAAVKDRYSQSLLRSVRGKVLAWRGDAAGVRATGPARQLPWRTRRTCPTSAGTRASARQRS
jgi:hypothetical protein